MELPLAPPAPTMPDKTPSLAPERPLAESWALVWLTNPPRQSRNLSLLIVLGIVAAIGWVDYATSIWFSFQLFYLFPIVLSVAWLGWKEGCVLAALCVVIRTAGDISDGILQVIGPFAVFWNRLIDVGISFTLVWVFYELISLQRQLEVRVQKRTAALEQAIHTRERLERELLEIAAKERNAIGRELHDDLCQHLVGTAFAAKVLAEHLAASQAPGAARDAQSIVGYMEEGIAKTRGLARGLLLASIEPGNLAGELANLATKGSEGGVPCRFRMEGRPVIEDAAAAAQLFRIAQEALRNALRHSDPKRVDIVLAGNDEATFLMIHDDGRGLPSPDARNAGLGLQIMEHRAALIGGTLSIVPAPGEGTRVICHIPHTLTGSHA
jgi:signal transduction histidine kinase